MTNILKHNESYTIKWYSGYKLGKPGTNMLSQMNTIVSKNEIKELK